MEKRSVSVAFVRKTSLGKLATLAIRSLKMVGVLLLTSHHLLLGTQEESYSS